MKLGKTRDAVALSVKRVRWAEGDDTIVSKHEMRPISLYRGVVC
jgi:hypothetical protein